MGWTYNIKCEDTVEFEFNNEQCVAEVIAEGIDYHQPEVMYYKDGSGQPEDDEIEITKLLVKSLYIDGSDCLDKYNSDNNFADEIDDCIFDELMSDMDYWEEVND